jgi:hypothetical protein
MFMRSCHPFLSGLYSYGVAGRNVSPVGVLTVGCVWMPVWLEPPLDTSRITVAAMASTSSIIATLKPTASAVESRRGGEDTGSGIHCGCGQNWGAC